MTAGQALDYVRKNPDTTCAEVAKRFRVSCGVAGATLRELRDAGKVRQYGRTKGTSYKVAPKRKT